MTEIDYAQLARDTYGHFNKHEFDEALQDVGDDVEVELYAQGLSFRGRDGFREMMQYHKAPFPDGEVEVLSQLAGNDGVVNECLYHATHTGPLPLPDGSEVPPTGKRISVRFVEIWRYRDGKLISLHNYSDNLEVMVQLGLMPAPASASA